MKELFAQLYEQEYDRVFRLCRGYFSGNRVLAEDATQEVFVKIWDNLASYREEAKLTTWIYRIAINVCLMQVRKASYRKELHVLQIPDVTMDGVVDEDEIRLSKMYSCIQQLEEVNRAIILMILEGVEYSEMAEVTGIKEETLRVKIHRIKQSLTKCVKQ